MMKVRHDAVDSSKTGMLPAYSPFARSRQQSGSKHWGRLIGRVLGKQQLDGRAGGSWEWGVVNPEVQQSLADT